MKQNDEVRLWAVEERVGRLQTLADQLALRARNLEEGLLVAQEGAGGTGGAGGAVFPVQLPAGGIAAGSPSSPVAATVYFYTFSGSGPALTPLTTTQTIYHILALAVPSGSHTGFVTQKGGFYYLVSWDGC